MRGFGANEVDLRGMRSPVAALAITSATDGGVTATTRPGCRDGGVQRLVEAVVVADLVLGHPPGGQQHLVEHRRVHRLGASRRDQPPRLAVADHEPARSVSPAWASSAAKAASRSGRSRSGRRGPRRCRPGRRWSAPRPSGGSARCAAGGRAGPRASRDRGPRGSRPTAGPGPAARSAGAGMPRSGGGRPRSVPGCSASSPATSVEGRLVGQRPEAVPCCRRARGSRPPAGPPRPP